MISKFDKIYKQIISQQAEMQQLNSEKMVSFRYFLPYDLSNSVSIYKPTNDSTTLTPIENKLVKKTDIYIALKGLSNIIKDYNGKVISVDNDNYSFYCDIVVPSIDIFNTIVKTIPYVDNDYKEITSSTTNTYSDFARVEFVDYIQNEMPLEEIIKEIQNYYKSFGESKRAMMLLFKVMPLTIGTADYQMYTDPRI